MPLDLTNLDLDLIRAEKSRRSLKEYIKFAWPIVEPTQPFVDGWHLDCFCDHLVHIDECRNLLVNCPPSVSKSLVFSVFYPTWKWITDPSYRFLFASYALSLAERDSLKCRRLVGSDLYQKCFGHLFQITDDQDTKRLFNTDKTGYRQAISVGSATKGLKGQLICCDDPHDASQATSDIKKKETIDWFQDSFLDRLCDFKKDNRCIVGQRISRGDLSEFILENYKSDWVHINLPWEYRLSDYVSLIGWKDPRTEEGQPLCPERFPDSAIRQLQKKSQTWAAQWQQNPQDSADNPFKSCNFKYYEDKGNEYVCGSKRVPKSECWKLASVDLAIATHNRADYTVFVTANVSRSGDIIVTDVYRDRIGGTKIVPRLVEYNAVHQPAYILIEDVAFQKMVIEQARAEGLPCRGKRPEGDKESRSLPLQIRMEHWQVWFPTEAPWRSWLEQELLEFPNGRHDDGVDALSMLALEVSKRSRTRPEAPAEAPKETEEERMRRGMFAGMR